MIGDTLIDQGTISGVSELDQLRAMTLDERLAWHKQHTRLKPVLNMYVTRVDGVLAAMGREEEFEDMLARFLKVLERLFKGKQMPVVKGVTVIELENGDELAIRPTDDGVDMGDDFSYTPQDARDIAAALVLAADEHDKR